MVLQGFFSKKKNGSTYEWDDTHMVDVVDEMFENTYPGLEEVKVKQGIYKMPMMSAVVSEVVLMECETEEDAIKAEEILNQRVTMQAEGGAWYPDSMEAWSRSVVVRHGNYVALLASGEHQDDLVAKFNALFE